MPEESNHIALCGLRRGTAHQVVEHHVLNEYRTFYFECVSCGSLQTAPPQWLAEAYAIPGVHIDVGQSARVIQT